jgi:AcrR family transcriptional regulator
MGNREDLIAGAKRCLYEKGYARTTARDIAGAAGTSLAAIGYHFRSKDALLMVALLEAFDEWGAELAKVLPAGSAGATGAAGDPFGHLEATWRRVTGSFTAHRPLWIASYEAFLQAEHSPELRAQLAAGQESARRGLAAALLGIDEGAVSERAARTAGSVQLALLSGLIVQWLVDPEHAPSGRDLVEGLREIMAAARERDVGTASTASVPPGAGEAPAP